MCLSRLSPILRSIALTIRWAVRRAGFGFAGIGTCPIRSQLTFGRKRILNRATLVAKLDHNEAERRVQAKRGIWHGLTRGNPTRGNRTRCRARLRRESGWCMCTRPDRKALPDRGNGEIIWHLVSTPSWMASRLFWHGQSPLGHSPVTENLSRPTHHMTSGHRTAPARGCVR